MTAGGHVTVNVLKKILPDAEDILIYFDSYSYCVNGSYL